MCEAVAETYLPLIAALRRLRAKGIPGGLTLSVSPVLAEQLAHSELPEILGEYLDERIRTGAEDTERFAREDSPELTAAARYWHDFHAEALSFYRNDLGGDVLGAFRDLAESGTLELATCGATHAYLPLLGRDETIALQLELARRTHERYFGQAPRGIWLPEMAYRPGGMWTSPTGAAPARHRPGLEEHVAGAGLSWFPVDAAMLLGGRSFGSYPDFFHTRTDLQNAAAADSPPHPRPRAPRDSHHSYWVARSNDRTPQVGCFIRDPRTSLQVWSGEQGYPGDGAYLEFHKKADSGGQRYWCVTGPDTDLADKAVYDPAAATERAKVHADHFVKLVESSLRGAEAPAVLVAPFDAELFGHWWYEGVAWIEAVLKRLHASEQVEITTVGRQWQESPARQVVALPEGSWGEGGHHYVWRNRQVDWIWDLIHPAEDELWQLYEEAQRSGDATALRLVHALARQLLVLSASDWPFLITTDGAADYAAERVRQHADDLAQLAAMTRERLRGAECTLGGLQFLEELEEREGFFPDLEGALAAAARPVGVDAASQS